MKYNSPVIQRRNGYAGIYIHFPYCIHKCSYCDFFSVGIGKNETPDEMELFKSYKKELLFRLEKTPSFYDLDIDSIFFGGGTPSLASPKNIKDFLDFLYSNLKITEDVEISLEANPENLDQKYLEIISDAGVNRLNVGVQSFQEEFLLYLNRFFDKEKYFNILKLLDRSPMERIGIDLIYGIPGQTLELFFEDIDRALDSKIDHISVYGLTVEENTHYHNLLKNEKIQPPNEELQEKILTLLPEKLATKDFYQYEVSNYAKLGRESKHNLKYWTSEYYIGIGPGAHGFTPEGRYANTKSIQTYIQNNFEQKYELPQEEDLFLTLFRLFSPIDLETFLEVIPEKRDRVQTKLREWDKQGHCNYKNGVFQWKPKSVLFLDNFIFQLACL